MKLVTLTALCTLPLKLFGWCLGFLIRPVFGGFNDGFSWVDKRYFKYFKQECENEYNNRKDS